MLLIAYEYSKPLISTRIFIYALTLCVRAANAVRQIAQAFTQSRIGVCYSRIGYKNSYVIVHIRAIFNGDLVSKF